MGSVFSRQDSSPSIVILSHLQSAKSWLISLTVRALCDSLLLSRPTNASVLTVATEVLGEILVCRESIVSRLGAFEPGPSFYGLGNCQPSVLQTLSRSWISYAKHAIHLCASWGQTTVMLAEEISSSHVEECLLVERVIMIIILSAPVEGTGTSSKKLIPTDFTGTSLCLRNQRDLVLSILSRESLLSNMPRKCYVPQQSCLHAIACLEIHLTISILHNAKLKCLCLYLSSEIRDDCFMLTSSHVGFR